MIIGSPRWSRWRRSAADARIKIISPQPVVEVALRAWTPDWLLRVVVLGLGIGSIFVLSPPGPLVPVIMAFLIAVLVSPGVRTGAVFCLAVGGTLVIFPIPTFSPDAFTLLATTTAVAALGSAIEQLPLTARIEWVALWPAAKRYLIIQLISQPFVFGAVLLQRRTLDVLPVAVVAAVVLAVAVWVLLPRLSRDR